MSEQQPIVIYKSPTGESVIEIIVHHETLWLTQKQISELFKIEVPAVSKHITNIYKAKELELNSTLSKMEIVQLEGKRSIKRKLDHYNLDMVISIGYRVNSVRGTQFRIWANKILKDYLLEGYAINKKKLEAAHEKLSDLKKALELLEQVTNQTLLSPDEAAGLLRIMTDYVYALDILDQYDHQALAIRQISTKEKFRITYPEAIKAIGQLKEKFGGSSLFGHEKDDSFRSSLAAIYHTFDGVDLYPSIEEKAAHLLYFIIKNHSFSDGNKRIAAFVFVWFMEGNRLLYNKQGQKRIADNALVALTLMIAESKAEEKEIMIKVVINLINRNNP